MKLIAAVIGVLVMSGGVCQAEEGVLNSPSKSVELVKRVVETLDPSYETLWLFSDGRFSQGVSASLWTFTSERIPVASLRLGFGTNENFYAGVGLDAPGIVKRWLPAQVKGIATTQPLDVLWAVAGKYARIMPLGGYSWNEGKAIYGVAVGAALTF